MMMMMVHFTLEEKTLYGSLISIGPSDNFRKDAGRDDAGLVTVELEGVDCAETVAESKYSTTLGEFFSIFCVCGPGWQRFVCGYK